MKLEITLTDEQAAPILAALLKIMVTEPEAIPADKPERKAREWEINHDGLSTYPIAISVPFDQKRIEPGMPVMAREILPGDPTPDQVATLADRAKDALAIIRRMGLTARECDRLESALQPFTGKEQA